MSRNTKKIKKEQELMEFKKNKKIFSIFFIILISILAVGFVDKTLQNDTFYTIKIGKLILENGIDMLDHFSFHSNLLYTYPHWLYDVFIYSIYKIGNFMGLYISSIVIFIILLILFFTTSKKITNNYSISAFATIMCALSMRGFITARAQLVSFLVFILQIYFIESFLQKGKKRYLIGLLILSLILCNIHVAVWPFYFIVFLPYIVEYIIAIISSKIKLKKENKLITFLKNKFIVENNKNMKYIILIMFASLLIGLFTPIGDTPYTYLIKTMMGNSQSYIEEHQMLSLTNAVFTIIIAFETILLSLISKVKLRDFFMIAGLVLMSIISTRHLSLLALIGCLCFARVFSIFLDNFNLNIDNKVLKFFNKKVVMTTSLILVTSISTYLAYNHSKEPLVDNTMYPSEVINIIKEKVNIEDMRIFNEYNFGSYLLLYDIPVFIDSRADLYTKQFSGFEYDILDDYMNIQSNYIEKFDFYNITHVLLYKDNSFNIILKNNSNYNILYEDEYYVFYERTN